jgi:hypothetical protein
MIRKTGAALAIATGVLGVIAVATPAMAAPEDGVINAGEFVLFEGKNYVGSRYDTNVSVNNYTVGPKLFHNGNPLNDKARSVANYSGYFVRAYENAYAGADLLVYPYNTSSGAQSWAYYDLGNLDLQISSHQFL